MKITLAPYELCAAIKKHYPALDGHVVTDVAVGRGVSDRSGRVGAIDEIVITMTPVGAADPILDNLMVPGS